MEAAFMSFKDIITPKTHQTQQFLPSGSRRRLPQQSIGNSSSCFASIEICLLLKEVVIGNAYIVYQNPLGWTYAHGDI